MLLYNIDFEIAAAAFLIVLNIYLRLQYTSDSRSNKYFKRLALILLFAVILDVVTAVTISFADIVPIWFNIALNTLYFCADVLLELQFVLYCTCATFGEIKHHIVPKISAVIALLCVIILFVNIFTGVVFSFDETGYVHGPLYMMVHFVPLAEIFVTCGMMLLNFPRFKTSQRISIILYILVLLSGPAIQLIHPNVLFILFTVAIGLMLLMFALETPDYQALNHTMNELRTTRDEAEEAMAVAQSASQAKTDFLSTMSHEVRTPINAILGYNEMVLRETEDPDITQYSTNIQSAGKALLAMISDMMDYTEIETGSFHIEETKYSTASMLSDITTCGRYYADKKDIELRISFDPEIPRALAGDSVRITRIFNNLLSNSVKFTDSGHVEISVSWKAEDDNSGWLCAKVRDTGIGMKEEDIARISSSFLRMEKKRNQNIQGIGLGLTIVTRLLSMMGSYLDVSSEYGTGTTMSFELKQGIIDPAPLGDVSALTESAEKTRRSPGFTAPNARILAVDDNSTNLELYKGSLRDTKIRIDTAVNGVEALELINRNNYDLIMLDHMMPVMDGMETLKTIKKQNLCPNVPIIVITANAVSGEKSSYLNAGFDDYLSKPVSGSQLWETVRKYLPERLIQPMANFAPAVQNNEPNVVARLSEFLNTSAALQYCCDNDELYLEIIGTYLEEDKTELIRQYFEANDIDNYRIQVHALKSGSRTIGAFALSDEALGLETAAKNHDVDYISANTLRVLEEYNDLMEKIRAALGTAKRGALAEDSGRVLYVDDDIMYRCLVERMLKESFGGITAVPSGEEALEQLRYKLPEVILLDLNLGGMDGCAVLKALKSDERLRGIPVVVFSSDNDRDTQVRCFRAGAVDFIAKPADREVLIERLKRLTADRVLS